MLPIVVAPSAEPSPTPRARWHEGAGRLSRRSFLGAGALIGGAFTLSFSVPVLAARGLKGGGETMVGAWVRVAPNGQVTIGVGSADMGQGVYTALPQILADEMKVAWKQVSAEAAPVAPGFGNPGYGGLQLTGGSMSVRGYYAAMRSAGAAVREMMMAAAAATWGVSPSDCIASGGKVKLKGSKTTLSYGELAPLAALQPVPPNPPWTADNKLKLIGKSVARTDIPAKVDGSAQFGMDVRLPGMLYATVVHCPKMGGSLVGIPAVPAGALAVVPLGNAVAVVASNTWAAFKAARSLQAQWHIPPESSQLDTTVINNQAQALMASGSALVAEQVGDVAAQYAASTTKLDLTYDVPYLAHGCMEVLNATASVSDTLCEIWAPTQGQGINIYTAQALTGLPADKIKIHTTLLGGGLGRKFEQDFIAQAITVAKAMAVPVKLTWTREQDFGNDRYRPMSLVRVRAGFDSTGAVNAFWVRTVSPSIAAQRGPLNGVDSSAVEGSVGLPYAFVARQTEWVQHTAAIPVGYWRSVGHSINAFVVESALDELALARGLDPYVLRRQLLANAPRALAVLDAAATLADWQNAPPAGRARGIAFHESFGSLCAQVAEVSINAKGKIVVNKVALAIDCGKAVNPNIVMQQMQGGVVHGLSAALWGQMKFSKGTAQARNFDNYRVLLLSEMPQVSVSIVNSGEALGGIGEPGVPPIGPAVANAWAALTGTRLRSLPLFPGDSHMSDF